MRGDLWRMHLAQHLRLPQRTHGVFGLILSMPSIEVLFVTRTRSKDRPGLQDKASGRAGVLSVGALRGRSLPSSPTPGAMPVQWHVRLPLRDVRECDVQSRLPIC